MPTATDACLIQDSTSRDIENRFKNDHPMKHDWTTLLREPSNRAHSWCYWIRQTSTFSARTGHPLWSKWPHLYPSSLIYFKCFYGINSLHFKKLHKQKLFSRKKKVGLRYHSRFKWVLSKYATTIFPYEQKCVEFKSKIDTKPTLSTRLMMPSLIARYSLKLSFKTCSIKTHSKTWIPLLDFKICWTSQNTHFAVHTILQMPSKVHGEKSPRIPSTTVQ